MKKYSRKIYESIKENDFWKIIRKYKNIKVKIDNNFCTILFPALGARGQFSKVAGKDTMLGQEIKNVRAQVAGLFKILQKYNFEDIAIQGPQDNEIFIVDDTFQNYKIKSLN